jgi:sialic acid synthase SpsE
VRASGPRRFDLGPHPLAADAPPVFLAEIGGFFGQDYGLAEQMVRRIIACGREVPQQPMALKTEVLHDPDVCLPGDTLETYASKSGEVKQENYRALVERKAFPLAHYAALLAICRDAGMPVVLSVYDFAGADFAVAEQAAALKIASGNVVHVPLIRYCATRCAEAALPLVIDTGRATLAEVHQALDVARAAGCLDIVVEHSPDGHPALPQAHNLRILQTYARAFDLPVGLSDHHVGLEMLYMAVALGATVVEKGVHVAPDALDIDISHTMDMADLPRLLRTLYDSWRAMGRPTRNPADRIEGVIGTSQRACLVARRDLAPGDTIGLETMRFAWPCLGIPVQYWDLVAGWAVTRPVAAGRPVGWQDVQQQSR